MIRTSSLSTGFIAGVLAALGAVNGCGSDTGASPSRDAGSDVASPGDSSTVPDVGVEAGVPAVLPSPDPCAAVAGPRSCCLGELKYGGLAGTDKSCGPTGSDSCCKFDDVPGGTFNRMNNPAFPATLPEFKLGRYLVTTARFSVWMDEGGGLQANAPPVSPAHGSGAHPTLGAVTGWQAAWNPGGTACGGVGCLAQDLAELKTRVYKDPASVGAGCTLDHYPDQPKLPVSCVGLYEATAFCAWDGGYLITEAMWEYATRGGAEQRPFAWGGQFPTGLDYAVYCIQGGGTWGIDLWCDNPAAPFWMDVGSSKMGQGKFGTFDLQGDLVNLTADDGPSVPAPMPVPCSNDCVNRITPDPNRVVARGIGDLYPDNLAGLTYPGVDAGPDAGFVVGGDMITGRPLTFRKNFWGAEAGFRCAYPVAWTSP